MSLPTSLNMACLVKLLSVLNPVAKPSKLSTYRGKIAMKHNLDAKLSAIDGRRFPPEYI